MKTTPLNTANTVIRIWKRVNPVSQHVRKNRVSK